MASPTRRTVIVLITLITAMTAVGGYLLVMEPGPRGPMPSLTLSSVNRGSPDNPQPEPLARWTAIAIHFSGSPSDTPASLAAAHQRAGIDPMSFHFVIGNGDEMPDGQVAPGPRWSTQSPGYSAALRGEQGVIDICLIGDGRDHPPTDAQMQKLVALVRELQTRLQIPPDRLYLYRDAQTGIGRLFPTAWFTRQVTSGRSS